MRESENKKVLERMGDQTPRGTAISLRQCATTSCTAHDTQQATAGAYNQSTVSLLHSLFRSCLLSAPGLARNVLKIHPWNNKV